MCPNVNIDIETGFKATPYFIPRGGGKDRHWRRAGPRHRTCVFMSLSPHPGDVRRLHRVPSAAVPVDERGKSTSCFRAKCSVKSNFLSIRSYTIWCPVIRSKNNCLCRPVQSNTLFERVQPRCITARKYFVTKCHFIAQ